MTNIFRLKTLFTGMPGGPGVATMYFRDVATAVPSVRQFWNGLALFMPSDVHIVVENLGDIINDATGDLVDTWFQSPVAPLDGGANGNYAAPAGASITWETGVILNGHRLRGRTFVIPTVASAFEANGSLAAATVTGLSDAAGALIAAQNNSFVIWHRPFAGAAAVGTKPARPAFVGSNALVTGGRVIDKIAVLRSRQN